MLLLLTQSLLTPLVTGEPTPSSDPGEPTPSSELPLNWSTSAVTFGNAALTFASTTYTP